MVLGQLNAHGPSGARRTLALPDASGVSEILLGHPSLASTSGSGGSSHPSQLFTLSRASSDAGPHVLSSQQRHSPTRQLSLQQRHSPGVQMRGLRDYSLVLATFQRPSWAVAEGVEGSDGSSKGEEGERSGAAATAHLGAMEAGMGAGEGRGEKGEGVAVAVAAGQEQQEQATQRPVSGSTAPLSIPVPSRTTGERACTSHEDDGTSTDAFAGLHGAAARMGWHASLPSGGGSGFLSSSTVAPPPPFCSSLGVSSMMGSHQLAPPAAGAASYIAPRVPLHSQLRVSSQPQLTHFPSNASILSQAHLSGPHAQPNSPSSPFSDTFAGAITGPGPGVQHSHMSFSAVNTPSLRPSESSFQNLQAIFASHGGVPTTAGNRHSRAADRRPSGMRHRIATLISGALSTSGAAATNAGSNPGSGAGNTPTSSLVPRSGVSFLMPGALLARARAGLLADPAAAGTGGGGGGLDPAGTTGQGADAVDDDAAWGCGPAPTWGETLQMLWPVLSESDALESLAGGGAALHHQGNGDRVSSGLLHKMMFVLGRRASVTGLMKPSRSSYLSKTAVMPVNASMGQPGTLNGGGGGAGSGAHGMRSVASQSRLNEGDWDYGEMRLSMARSSKPNLASQPTALSQQMLLSQQSAGINNPLFYAGPGPNPPSAFAQAQWRHPVSAGNESGNISSAQLSMLQRTFTAEALALSADASTQLPQVSTPPATGTSNTVSFLKRAFSLNRQRSQTAAGLGAGAQQQLVFRGLRVRMGAHVGLQSTAEMHQSRAAGGRVRYTGVPLKIATAVSSAACGGAVLLSQAALKRLIADANLGEVPCADVSNHGNAAREAGGGNGQGNGVGHGSRNQRGSNTGNTRNVLPAGAIISYMGDHELEGLTGASAFMGAVSGGAGSCGGWPIYSVVPEKAFARMAHLARPTTKAVLRRGVLDAPVVAPTFVFIYVVGAQQLLADVPLVAREALDTLQALCSAETWPLNGYVVEAADSYLLAAFPRACDALAWGLACRAELLSFPGWDRELLAHPMAAQHLAAPLINTSPPPTPARALSSTTAEAAAATAANQGPHALGSSNQAHGSRAHSGSGRPSGSGAAHGAGGALQPPVPGAVQVLERGPRIKVGVDCGCVTAELHPYSGRLNYRGKVLNRAARVANQAAPGQVVCTARVWSRAVSDMAAYAAAGQLPPSPRFPASQPAVTPQPKSDSKGALLAVPETPSMADGESGSPRISAVTPVTTPPVPSPTTPSAAAGYPNPFNPKAPFFLPAAAVAAGLGAAASSCGGASVGAPSRPRTAAPSEAGAQQVPRLVATAMGSVALKGIPDLVELFEVSDPDDSPVWAVPKKQPQQRRK